MNTSENSPALRYDNILASSRGLTETQSKKVVLFIPKSDIARIDLKFGRSSHRPLLTLILGAIFVPIGLYGIIDFFLRPAGLRYEMGMAAFGLIGGSLIFDTLKKRYFFEVCHSKGISRLVFTKKADLQSILEFCAKATDVHGYQMANKTEQDAAANP